MILREARRRAGLSQQELAHRVGRPQQSIARWERGRVEPSFETLEELVRACGWELLTDLARADPEYEAEIRRQLRLSPDARLRSTLRAEFDPLPIIASLEASGVRSVLVGALAAALRGSPRLIDAPVVEIVPARGQERTLEGSLARLGAETAPPDGERPEDRVVGRSRHPLSEDAELWLTERPLGSAGFVDLVRDAEPVDLGSGVSAQVASVEDLARIAAAAPAETEGTQAATLRTVARLAR